MTLQILGHRSCVNEASASVDAGEGQVFCGHQNNQENTIRPSDIVHLLRVSWEKIPLLPGKKSVTV